MKRALQILLCVATVFINTASSQVLRPVWQKFVGGGAIDHIEDARVTADNGIFFTGSTVGPGSGIIPPFPLDTTRSNLIIGKLDSNYTLAWVKVFGGSQHDRGVRCLELADGGLVVLGYSGSADGDANGPNATIGGLWLVRFTSGGSLLWQKRYGLDGITSVGGGIPLSITATSDGGFALLGSSNYGTGDIPYHYTNNPFVQDWFVIKVDGQGAKQWVQVYGGNGNEGLSGEIFEVAGTYYLFSFSNSRDHDCVDTVGYAGTADVAHGYVLKINGSGSVDWSKAYGGDGGNEIVDAVWDSRDSSLVFVGYGKSSDHTSCGSSTLQGLWVVKINRQGQPQWVKCIGDGYVVPKRISLAPEGYIVLGKAIHTNNLPPGHIGQDDGAAFLLRLDGMLIAQKYFGSTSWDDLSSIIAHRGGFLVLGSSAQAFTEGQIVSPITGKADGVIVRLEHWPLQITSASLPTKLLSIYPTPAESKILIERTTVGGEDVSISIYSNMGELVYQGVIPKTSKVKTVNVGSWARGNYILRATSTFDNRVSESQVFTLR